MGLTKRLIDGNIRELINWRNELNNFEIQCQYSSHKKSWTTKTHVFIEIILSSKNIASYQITQLNNLNTNFDISIFPNPTSDNINIDYNINNARADLFIKDIRGATIYYSLDFSTNKRQTIDISKFAPGVYVLEIILNSKNKIVYQIQKLN